MAGSAEGQVAERPMDFGDDSHRPATAADASYVPRHAAPEEPMDGPGDVMAPRHARKPHPSGS